MFCGVLSLLPPPSPSRPRYPYEALSRQFIAWLCIFTLCLSYVLTCPVLLWCCVLPPLLPPLRPRYLDEALARQFTTAVRVGKKSKEAGKSIKEVRAHASRSYSIVSCLHESTGPHRIYSCVLEPAVAAVNGSDSCQSVSLQKPGLALLKWPHSGLN